MAFAQKLDEPMTLHAANENLRALNGELKSYYKMTPEGRAAIGVTDGVMSGMEDGAQGSNENLRALNGELKTYYKIAPEGRGGVGRPDGCNVRNGRRCPGTPKDVRQA